MAATSPITLVFNAVDQASPVLKNLVGQVQNQLGIVTQLSFAYNEVTRTLQILAAQGAKAYDLLIGQNVRLQEQLLGTKASLVATNKILENGLEIKDPTKAIKALNEPVNAAIKSLREGSLELVGVTSSQLVPIYQLVAQNAGAIGLSLQQASDLTLDFSAALGTLGIPLFQANEEINSILNGTITTNSRLAKSLDINNAQVASWKAQGVLVDKLTQKLSAFRAGNALAAQTINGVTSNIEEIVQEITRIAGEPLLAPIVAQLTEFYNYLKDNKEAIQDIAVTVVNFFLGIGEKLGEVFTVLAPVFKTLGEALFTQIAAEAGAAAKVITILVDGFVLLVKVAEPLLQILSNIVLTVANFASTDIGVLILQATLLTAIIGNLSVKLVAFTAIQLVPFLLSLVPAFIGTTEAINLFFAALNGSAGAQVALNLLIPLAGQVTAAFVAAGGGIAGFLAAANTLLVIPVIMSAIAASVAVVATGLALLVKNTNDLRVANEELEDFRKINDDITDSALKTATGLAALNKAAKENGTITKEQEESLKRLRNTAKLQVGTLQDQIKALKEIQPANEEQKNNQDAQVKLLERYIDLLNKQSGGVTTAALDLQNLGNDYQQLAEKVRNAQAQFEKPASAEIFAKAAKDIVDFTAKQVEAGGISAKLAIQNLEQVRNDIRLEYDQRIAAQEAIIKIRQTEVDRRVKITENEQQQIQSLISNQVVGDAEGQRQISANKIKQLNIQLEATKKNIAEETKLRNSQINVQVGAIVEKIAEAEKAKEAADKAGDKQASRLASEDIKRLQQERNNANAGLALNNEKLLQQKNQETKFANEIAQEKGKEAQRQQKETVKDFDEQQTILESANSQKLITQEQFNTQSLAISRRRAAVELKQLDTERKKLSDKDAEGLEVIAVRQATVRKKLADDVEKFEQQKSQSRLAKIDAQQKDLAARLEAGFISEQEFNRQSFEATRKRLQAELDEVNRQKARLKPGDSGLDPLNAQSADIRKKQLEEVEKFEQTKSKLRLALIDREQKELATKLSAGLLTEQGFNQQSFENTKVRLQAELDEVNRQKARFKDVDARLEPLNAQAAEIRKRQLDAVAENQDKQVQAIEKAQRKATEIINQSESERLNTITRLEADKTITGAKANELRVNNTRKTIEAEFQLEKDKLAALLALPAFTDPIREEQRQSQIRASRLKTSQLTKNLIDNEVQQREAIFRVFEDIKNKEIQAIQNQTNAQTQLLDNQIKLNDYAAKELGIQVRLLESRKELISTTATYLTGELKLLEEISTSESEKKQLAESAAEVRLRTAQEELVFARKLAILRNEERDNALEVEKIQLRIEQVKSRSATLSSQAEQAIVEANPNATKGQKEAAALKTQAAVLTENLLGQQAALLESRAFANQREAEAALIKQRNSSQLSVDQERLNLANSRVDKSLGQREKDQLAKDIRARRFTTDDGSEGSLSIDENTGRNLRIIRRETEFDKAKFNQSGNLRTSAVSQQSIEATRQIIAEALGLKIGTVPQTTNNQAIPQTRFTGNVPQNTVINKDGSLAPSVGGNFTFNITNSFSAADVASEKAANQFTEQIHKTLFDVFTLAGKR